jgi:hypothetical protein
MVCVILSIFGHGDINIFLGLNMNRRSAVLALATSSLASAKNPSWIHPFTVLTGYGSWYQR